MRKRRERERGGGGGSYEEGFERTTDFETFDLVCFC
jgi:hypothetical protein